MLERRAVAGWAALTRSRRASAETARRADGGLDQPAGAAADRPLVVRRAVQRLSGTNHGPSCAWTSGASAAAAAASAPA